VNPAGMDRSEYDRLVMDHLLNIENTAEAIASDVADIKASVGRIIAQCEIARAMLVRMGREIERVH
jgi:hypothetical protein